MLHLHTAGDLEALADELAAVLSPAPEDPMQPDLVAVPSAAMRTWLSLQLAQRLGAGGAGRGAADSAGDADRPATDGISANIAFPFPGSLRQRVLAAGDTALSPESDPWSVEHLVWAVLEVADSAEDDPHLAGLPPGLRNAPVGTSRYGVARRVADLFDRYHLHRPAMVQSWAAGSDVDGTGVALPAHHLWQPALWRAVRAHLATPSPPERLAEVLPRLEAGELTVDLPDRLAVFGMSLLPGGPGFVDLAAALGHQREVHLFVVTPSPLLTDRFRTFLAREGAAAGTRNAAGHRLRTEIDTSDIANPLLRSWGRLHHETASVLVDSADRGLLTLPPSAGQSDKPGPSATPPERSHAGSSPTLLRVLQHDIRDDRAPAADLDRSPDSPLGAPGTRPATVEFHACYGPTRQVEVLRDTIVRLLDTEPIDGAAPYEESDILVVCPALDTFAPLIEATFGPSAHTGAPTPADGTPPTLRYHLADRSLGESAPLVGAFLTLLDLVVGRFDAPAVLDFLTLEPVRRRHGIGDDELASITQWVLDLNVRWGLDPASREAHGVPATITTNTWEAGIQRLLLGAAVLEPVSLAGGAAVVDTVGSVIPYPNEGSAVAVAGRLVDVLHRLGELADLTDTPRPVEEWLQILCTAVVDFLDVPRSQTWQLDRLLATLGGIEASARRPGAEKGESGEPSATPLTFTDVRRLLQERLHDPEHGRPSFFRGGVTISSLTPLRWVPHRVIVMLGMDSPALSASAADGDDLVAATPLVGDRDRRSELRQSLLETVLAARDHLVVIRDGHDVRTNQPVPMPVAVAELHDTVLAMAAPAHRKELAEHLERHHPRQPFHETYFTEPPSSFDRRALVAAEARRAQERSLPAFLADALDPPDPTPVTLADLHRVLRNPIRYFLEQRLEMRLPRDEAAPSGVLSLTVGGLETYALGDSLLSVLLAAGDPDPAVIAWRDAMARTGAVPPGSIGATKLDEIQAEVATLADTFAALGGRAEPTEPPRSIEVVTTDGTTVTGTVSVVLDPIAGDPRSGPALAGFVRRRPEHLLRLWLDLAALTLAHPDTPWRGVIATRTEKTEKTKAEGIKVAVTVHELDPDDPVGAAHAALDLVVDLHQRALCEALPLFRKISADLHAYPAKLPKWPDEFADGAEALVYGHLSAAELCAIEVQPHDPPGPAEDRARRYADHLYGALASGLRQVPT